MLSVNDYSGYGDDGQVSGTLIIHSDRSHICPLRPNLARLRLGSMGMQAKIRGSRGIESTYKTQTAKRCYMQMHLIKTAAQQQQLLLLLERCCIHIKNRCLAIVG